MPKEEKIRIYLDSGADISFLKSYYSHCEFYNFPYDSEHRRKKAPKVRIAHPSEVQWDDCNIIWDETEFTFYDFSASPIYDDVTTIIGKNNRRDVLHFDSAYKTKCTVFLTSDKEDIWSKRSILEALSGIKTFRTPYEQKAIREYISILTDQRATVK